MARPAMMKTKRGPVRTWRRTAGLRGIWAGGWAFGAGTETDGDGDEDGDGDVDGEGK